MLKSERGDVYVNWAVAIINQTEKNIMIELIDETTNN